jgi:hypothetical protein
MDEREGRRRGREAACAAAFVSRRFNRLYAKRMEYYAKT